jgi:hypothetical protein
MPDNDGGFRHSEPYVEMADPPLWRAEADAHVHRLLVTPMSPRGRWERISTELVYRARATPLWSEAAAAVPVEERMLDRVVDLRIVVRLLIGHPADAPAILDVLGVGCVVSQAEAQRLSSIRPDAGWEAYETAGVRVVDAESGAPFNLVAAARRQRELLASLRVPAAAAPAATPSAWPAPDPARRDQRDLTPPAGTATSLAGASPAAASATPPASATPTATTATPPAPPTSATPPFSATSPTSATPPSPPGAAPLRGLAADPAAATGQPLVMRPGAVRLANADVLETFVPVLRQLVGEAARITYGSNWIAATADHEYLKVTFGRPAPGTAVVSARVHNGRGHDDQVEDVVRHVSQDELLPATIAALVRVHDAARVAAETRLREVEAVSQLRSPRLAAADAVTAAGQPLQPPLAAPPSEQPAEQSAAPQEPPTPPA